MPTPQKQRVMWVDIAKGMSIILVVALHLSTFGASAGYSPGFWYEFSRAFEHLRLPLFFMASGLFAAKIRTFTFAELFCKRTWVWGVPFMLWGGLVLIAKHYVLGAALDNFWAEWIRGFLFPDNGIWFLMALLVFTLVVWIVRKVPGRYVLAVSLVLTLVMPFLGSPSPSDYWWSWRRLAMYFSSYCIGLYGRDIILRIVRKARWYHALALFALLSVAEHFYKSLTNDFAISASNIGLIVLGLLTGVSIAVTLDGSHIGKLFSYIGKHTLEIYLLNEVLTWIYFKNIVPHILFNHDPGNKTWPMEWIVLKPEVVWTSINFWSVIIGVVFVTGVALLFRQLIKGSRLDWVFTPPTFGWMQRWMENSRARLDRKERQRVNQLRDNATKELLAVEQERIAEQDEQAQP